MLKVELKLKSLRIIKSQSIKKKINNTKRYGYLLALGIFLLTLLKISDHLVGFFDTRCLIHK